MARTTKPQRVALVYELIRHRQAGMTEPEMANALNMPHKRRTINNDLRELAQAGKIIKEEDSPIWFALPEA